MSKFMTCVKLPIEPVNVGVGVYNNELLSKWEAKITGNIFRSLVQYVFLKKVLMFRSHRGYLGIQVTGMIEGFFWV